MSARKEFEDVELPEAPADAQRFLNGDVDAHAGAVEYPGPSQPYKVAQQVMRELYLSLIHISEPTRRLRGSRMPSSA